MGRRVPTMSDSGWSCCFTALLVACAVFLPAVPAQSAWLPDGTPLCDLPGEQSAVRVVSDGSNGAIVVWQDGRSGSGTDIYAQRVDMSGNPLWTPEGVAICTASGNQSDPEITTDDAGGAVIAWCDYRNGVAHDVYAQRVNADGEVLWTAGGVAVCTAVDYQFALSIIPGGLGGAIIAWEDHRNGVDYDIYAQRVGGDGSISWQVDGRPICTASGNQYHPSVVSDGSNGGIIAWSDYRTLYSDIYAQRVNLAGTPQWTTDGVLVCSAAYYQGDVVLTTDGSGGAVMAWQDSRNAGAHDIYAQRMTSAGTASWAANGVAVCTATGTQTGPKIVSDGSGGAVIAWADYRGSDSDIYSQRLSSAGAAQWTTNGVLICGAVEAQFNSALTSNGSGGAIVTWHDTRQGGLADIYAQEVGPSGVVEWVADGIVICSASESQWYPDIVSDDYGGAIIAWEDYRSAVSYDTYANRVDGDGNAGWTACGVPISVTTGNQAEVEVVTDGGQGAILVWEDYRNGTTNPDVYAQRVFSDGYRLWSKNGVAVSTAPSYQNYLTAAPDGSDGLLVAWQDLRNGGHDVYAQRVSPVQAMLWRPDGAVVCSTTANTYLPEIVSDGAGGAIVVWENIVGGGASDVYAQRLDSSGSQMWAAAGVSLCSAANDQQEPQIVSDGAGGAIVAWVDMRGATVDIYANRVNSSGSPQWPADGTVVSGAAGAQNSVKMVPDGSGGAIFCWKDSRSGNYDIYAQRLNSTGMSLWTLNGVEVCATAGQQQNPSLIPDGSGGAIICWEDYRSGSADVYAQRLNSSGVEQWTADGVTVCAATGAQSVPNIVMDGDNGAIVTWQDSRSGVTVDVYAQRLDPDGGAMWGTDGVAICASDVDDTRPVLTCSMPGQAIIAWTSYDPTLANDVYALSTSYVIAVPEEQAPAAVVPRVAELDQNFPNPFNPVTKIAFTLRDAARVRLCVYDIAGRMVCVLEEGTFEPGRHEVVWDGTDSAGDKVASGVYFYGLEMPGAGGLPDSRKLVIIR